MNDRRASTIVILAPPRSGSSWLASLVRNTRRLGECREWLTPFAHGVVPRFEPPAPARDARTAFAERLAAAARTTNGVLGIKLIATTLPGMAAALAPWGFGDDWDAELLPNPLIVLLRREDILGRAISWWRAKATGVFAKLDADPGADSGAAPPLYDRAALVAALDECRGDEELLDRWAARLARLSARPPLELVYERLLAAPAAGVAAIADAAGVELDARIDVASPLAVQRDAWSDEVRRRFEAGDA